MVIYGQRLLRMRHSPISLLKLTMIFYPARISMPTNPRLSFLSVASRIRHVLVTPDRDGGGVFDAGFDPIGIQTFVTLSVPMCTKCYVFVQSHVAVGFSIVNDNIISHLALFHSCYHCVVTGNISESQYNVCPNS